MGTNITGWVFDSLNHPDETDSEWIGATGLGYDTVDDRGFIVRFNNAPSSDVHWYPGDVEPGDPLWHWEDWYWFFGSYGFNNSAWERGLANSVDGENEVYEVAYRMPETGGGGTGVPPPCTILILQVCDPKPPTPPNVQRGGLEIKVADTTMAIIDIAPTEVADNVTYGETAEMEFVVVNWTGQTQDFVVEFTDTEGFTINPSTISLTLDDNESTFVTTYVALPSSQLSVGIRDTIIATTPDYETYSWFEVADQLDHLGITPAEAYPQVGDTVYYGLYGYDTDGRILTVEPYWDVLGGIGSVSAMTTAHIPEEMCQAEFIAENAGEGYVRVRAGAVADCVYVHVAESYPGVIVELTYVSGSPVPAEGGNLYFDVYVENADPDPQDFDAWLDVEYEGGPPTTVVLRSFTNYLSGWTINRPNMFFPVPREYAPGNYMLYGRVGDNPGVIWDEDGFPFVKMGDADGSGFVPFIPAMAFPDPFEVITKSDPEGTLPEEFALSNVYPNPFNPTVNIGFTLPEAGRMMLSVHDINGRLIKTLVDGYRMAGTHEITFDGSDLASGVYLVRLEIDYYHAVKKLVLMK
jgi:hypothetical protein